MKLKEKLIHWLGGYTYQEHKQVSIIQTTKPVITLKSVSYLPVNPMIEDIDYCKQELAYQIAEDMANSQLIQFVVDYPEKITAITRVVDMQ